MASVGPGLLEERMRVGRLLWSNDISAEYSTADNPKLNKQMNEVSFLVDTSEVDARCLVALQASFPYAPARKARQKRPMWP